MIRLLLVDDHPIVREGLATVLGDQPDLQVAGSAGSAEEAVELAGRLRPDVVLLDLELPGQDGITTLPRPRESAPEAAVLVFTAYGTEERVLAALRGGARGYLLKGARAEEIARAIRIVCGGGTYLEPSAAALLARAGGGSSPELTPREREVLRLLAQGLPNKQIGRELGITERTVKFHVSSLLSKLDAESRVQLVRVAVDRGLAGDS